MRASSAVLLALSQTALAQTALAQPPAPSGSGQTVVDGRASYQYSRYEEDDLKAGRSASGDAVRRYSIDTHHFRLAQPVFGDGEASLDLRHETMSGASPFYVMPVGGKAVQVMSGASIREERTAIDAGWTLALDRLATLKLSAGYSREDDYRSWSLGVEGGLEDAARMTRLALGIGHSWDDIEPVHGASPVVVDREKRRSFSAYASLDQVLGASTRLQLGLSGQWQQGYLGDPYKLVCISASASGCDSLMRDERPDERGSIAATLRLRQALPWQGAAVHLDYRYFQDNWDIHANTLSLGLHRGIGPWYLAADLRWHSQSQAGFYAPWLDAAPADGLASSDYRLSPYGALGLSMDISRRVGDWTLAAGAGAYRADADLASGKVEVANPGLVSYRVGHVRISRHY